MLCSGSQRQQGFLLVVVWRRLSNIGWNVGMLSCEGLGVCVFVRGSVSLGGMGSKVSKP